VVPGPVAHAGKVCGDVGPPVVKVHKTLAGPRLDAGADPDKGAAVGPAPAQEDHQGGRTRLLTLCPKARAVRDRGAKEVQVGQRQRRGEAESACQCKGRARSAEAIRDKGEAGGRERDIGAHTLSTATREGPDCVDRHNRSGPARACCAYKVGLPGRARRARRRCGESIRSCSTLQRVRTTAVQGQDLGDVELPVEDADIVHYAPIESPLVLVEGAAPPNAQL
jgi:hypothetical protein